MLQINAEISELIDTLTEAAEYLINSSSIGEVQLRIAMDISDTVITINESIEAEETIKEYSSMMKTCVNLETIGDLIYFWDIFKVWKEAVLAKENNEQSFMKDDSTECDFGFLCSSKRQIRNSVDRNFYQLMDEIGELSEKKILYNIRKSFEKLKPSIQENLENYVFKFRFWGSLNKKNMDFNLLENRARELKNSRDKFLWLYEKLEDYRSKKTLYAILNNWYKFDFQTLIEVKEMCYKDYFDLDILKCDSNEVMVDLGAFIGDSVADYIVTYQNYKRIYCYEITPATFETLKNNLKSLPNIVYVQKGASDKEGVMYISPNETSISANILSDNGKIAVKTVAIDDDIKEPVTLIKMDIEGAEQLAIIGCKEHIKIDHPKLAISVYHNNVDIWKIAYMICEIDPSYRFYLRHNGGNVIPTEYILLGI